MGRCAGKRRLVASIDAISRELHELIRTGLTPIIWLTILDVISGSEARPCLGLLATARVDVHLFFASLSTFAGTCDVDIGTRALGVRLAARRAFAARPRLDS